jgi:hypothetical protein
MVIPIQNSSSNWMNAKGISKYSTKIFVSSIDKFKRCSRINNKHPIIFALSFQAECKLYYCIYNQCDFIPNGTVSLFADWFNKLMNFETINLNMVGVKSLESNSVQVLENNNLKITHDIPIYSNICLQDFLLLMEIYILRRKYKHFLNKNSKNIQEIEISLDLNFYELYRWPFNNHVFSFYILFYIYVYLFSTKPRRKKKLDIGRSRLVHAWNLSLKNKQIEFFNMLDFSFLNE